MPKAEYDYLMKLKAADEAAQKLKKSPASTTEPATEQTAQQVPINYCFATYFLTSKRRLLLSPLPLNFTCVGHTNFFLSAAISF